MSSPAPTLCLTDPQILDAPALLAIARGELVPVLSDELAAWLDQRRAEMLAALDRAGPVYGVSTGMGALSEHRVDDAAQAGYSRALLAPRAAGGPPWLRPVAARAVLAVRLRTFLNGDAGVSAALCRRLADMIRLGVLPAIPARPAGVAGEIVSLAHLGTALTGTGEVLATAGAGPAGGTELPGGAGRDWDGDVVPAAQALAAAGLEPLQPGLKEGVALIEGIPVATAMALLAAARASQVLHHCGTAVAAEFAVTSAAPDVLDSRLARGDDALAQVTGWLRELAGCRWRPRTLQPPVSFRASPQVLAQLRRATGALEAAAGRALTGVTDSPAFIGGEFIGSAGFYGYDLAAHLHSLTVALIGAAELGTTRLHRLMDPAVTGLTAQLAAQPGSQTGLTPVHKRAVGVSHELRRQAYPAHVGPVETSAGQEDAQAFTLEAARACHTALDGATEVLACELLAVHQARCLAAAAGPGAGEPGVTPGPLGQPGTAMLRAQLDILSEGLPASAADRAFGRDVELLRARLGA